MKIIEVSDRESTVRHIAREVDRNGEKSWVLLCGEPATSVVRVSYKKVTCPVCRQVVSEVLDYLAQTHNFPPPPWGN